MGKNYHHDANLQQNVLKPENRSSCLAKNVVVFPTRLQKEKRAKQTQRIESINRDEEPKD
jgi:hypothetical protein